MMYAKWKDVIYPVQKRESRVDGIYFYLEAGELDVFVVHQSEVEVLDHCTPPAADKIEPLNISVGCDQ